MPVLYGEKSQMLLDFKDASLDAPILNTPTLSEWATSYYPKKCLGIHICIHIRVILEAHSLIALISKHNESYGDASP